MDSNLVYLVQTDTTVGFSSANAEKLSDAKQRSRNQKILQTIDSFKSLNESVRIPKKHKKQIRRSKKTTFIYPNGDSYRLIDKKYTFYDFIEKFSSLYSSSANKTKENFDKNYAYEKADIIIENKNSFSENKPSSIIKLTKNKKIRIR